MSVTIEQPFLAKEKFFAKILSLLKKEETKKGAVAAISPMTLDTKLSVLWEKIRPYVSTLSLIFPRKLRPWLKYFLVKIDAVVAAEIKEEPEEG